MIKKNNAFIYTTYNFAIADSYAKSIRKLIREYYTLVSESAIDSFLRTGDFAELTAEELLISSGFDLRLLDKKRFDIAKGFIDNIELQTNAKFRNGYIESHKLLPRALIRPREYGIKTRNLISQQVQKIKGLEQYQYTLINQSLQDNIAKNGTLKDFKKLLKDIQIFDEKRINRIAKNQLTYATSIIYKNKAEELGLDDAIWQHPAADIYKTEPRPDHVAAHGRHFKLSRGCPIKNEKGKIEYIWPGEKINCKCYYLLVI